MITVIQLHLDEFISECQILEKFSQSDAEQMGTLRDLYICAALKVEYAAFIVTFSV